MRTSSRPVLISIATIVFDIVVLVLCVVYVLYSVSETFEYYDVGWDVWLYPVLRRISVLVAVVGMVLIGLVAALIGQVAGRRWGLWLGVVLHIGMAAVCAMGWVLGGFEVPGAVMATLVLLSNLAAAVFLVVRRRGDKAAHATPGQHPPQPPARFD